LEAALALARAAIEAGPNEGWNPLALGMAEYRSGRFEEADAALAQAMDLGKDNPYIRGTSAFFRAMSLFRLGKKDEALKLAIATVAKMKPLPADEQDPLAGGAGHDDVILWLIYKEAKS